MQAAWIGQAQKRLIALREGGEGWSYRPGCAPGVEPTALACLGLLNTAAPGFDAHAGASWLASLQRPEGSLGVSTALPYPGWPTAYALLVWSALGQFERCRERAAAWLLAQKGKTTSGPADGVVGHDASLTGWPWVPQTHSWLEPTALAVLALARQGLAGHPRIVEGLRLICDRAVPGGGWNYGNSAIFGRGLRAQPAPTGLALLALACAEPDSGSRALAARAARYLLCALPAIRAASSLGWGLLGLSAWGLLPKAADAWLAESAERNLDRPDAAPRLAILLLAAGAHPDRLLTGLPSARSCKTD